jgi:single-stranded-DNA-specific exonuclease
MTATPETQRALPDRGDAVEREWIIAAPHAERDTFAQSAGIAPLLAQILLLRGISRADQVPTFFTPDLRMLHPPAALPGTTEAAERLAEAVTRNERIFIYGDYDVDGVTATTILWHMLTRAGADVRFYIPSRLEEGYGLNVEALETIAREKGRVVITVDCGIAAPQAVQHANKLGLDVIITDHHQPGPDLPEAEVIVHPTAVGDSPNPDLSGAAVALKVAWALAQRLSGADKVQPKFREWLVEATAFAALGLVADCVPLTGENRCIVSFGLRQLCHTTNPGLQALIEVAGLTDKQRMDDFDVGFRLAPRLNAIGRMGHARLAVELFTRADAERAREIAATLDAENRRRQEVERKIVKQAEALVVERGYHKDSVRGIVLASNDWHPGVIGIVAARIVDRFHRPTFMIAIDGDTAQGSGRSVPHFPLHEVLQSCGEHLLSHGGHAMAAGVRLRPDQLDAFTTAFQAQAAQRLTDRDLQPKLHLDDEVPLAALTEDVVTSIERLAPFGQGNARPRLATEVVQLVDTPRAVGRNQGHLQFSVRQGNVYRKAIAFGRGSDLEVISQYRTVRVAFEPIISEWNGRRRVELKALDWKPAHA